MSRGFREKAAEPGDIRTGFQRERLGGSPSPGETPAGAAAALAGPRGVPGIRGRGPGARLGAKPQTRMRAQCTPRLLKEFGVPFVSIFV